MARFALKLILCLLVALTAGFGYLALRSVDALYSFYEWISPARFQKYGTAGERGLIQVNERAANEWSHEHKIENFNFEQLFDPRTNLESGSWYLRRALDHWQNESEPLPFALAEYNAGASRAQRWVGADGITTSEFLGNIDFPITRKYVQSILDRYAFYKRRGRM